MYENNETKMTANPLYGNRSVLPQAEANKYAHLPLASSGIFFFLLDHMAEQACDDGGDGGSSSRNRNRSSSSVSGSAARVGTTREAADESVKVFIRIRPLSKTEIEAGHKK